MKVFHISSTSASHAGVTYERGDDGAFDVPDDAAAELLAHGFSAAPAVREIGQLCEHAECLAALERVTVERDDLHAQLAAAEETFADYLDAFTEPADEAEVEKAAG